jgi:flagellar basal-body rod modification protein FlgD
MSSVGSTSNSGDIRSDYMNLLLAQLQNQNPLEPMDNSEMSAQLTMLSQLEQLENMQITFADVLESQQTSQASDLIGKEISFYAQDSQEVMSAIVERVINVDGEPHVVAGGYELALDGVLSIVDGEATESFQGIKATEWLGKEVTFLPSTGGYVYPVTGTVERVETLDGETRLIVDAYKVALEEIQSVGLND